RPAPDRVQELFLRQQPPAVLDQVTEHPEGLGPQPDLFGAAEQRAALNVEYEITEAERLRTIVAVAHAPNPPLWMSFFSRIVARHPPVCAGLSLLAPLVSGAAARGATACGRAARRRGR